jgi:small subunit ribosomal protein S6
MFLFDTSRAVDYAAMEEEVGRLMQRASAELVSCKKWDERKLAYEIRGRKRGCYVLTYFKAEADKIVSMERDARLSESILRLLVLRADNVSEEKMQAPSPIEAAAAERDASRARAAEAAAREAEQQKPEPEPAGTATATATATAEAPEPAPAAEDNASSDSKTEST